MTVGLGLILGWGTKIPRAMWPKKEKINCKNKNPVPFFMVKFDKNKIGFANENWKLSHKTILKNHFLCFSVSVDLNLDFSIWDTGKSWYLKSTGSGRKPLGVWGQQ